MLSNYLILAVVLIVLVLFYVYIPRFFSFPFESNAKFAVIISNLPLYIGMLNDLRKQNSDPINIAPIYILIFIIIAMLYIFVNWLSASKK